MNILYSTDEYQKAKLDDLLPCKCNYCLLLFKTTKRKIQSNRNNPPKFCSKKCQSKSQIKTNLVECKNCKLIFNKKLKHINKTTNHFCTKSCASKYNSTHRKPRIKGTVRSKLEVYIEEQLTNLYPNLEIHYNKRDTIGMELDIYIPSLNIAFELNGIFHYEPIYGKDKLERTIINDLSKSKACHEAKIDLCVIDTSQQKYVKPSTSQKYLDIITNIINER